MKAAIIGLALGLAAAAHPASAQTVIDFEAGTPGAVVPFGSYGGLTWTVSGSGTWARVNPDLECGPNPCGFYVGRTSGNYVATNGFDGTGIITAASPWQALSLQLGSAWADLTVQFQGYLGGTQVWSQSFSAVPTASNLITFNPGLIDELRVTATITGPYTYTLGSGPRMVWDDFRVNLSPASGIPEPASWALMLGGFFLLGAAVRRERKPAWRAA